MSDNKSTFIPLPDDNSKIWKFFGFISKDNKIVAAENKANVFCRMASCSKPSLHYCDNMTNLTLYLRLYHQSENVDIVSSLPSTAYSPISMFFRSAVPVKHIEQNSEHGRLITGSIVSFLVEDARAFFTVCGSGFHKMIKVMSPKYPLASDAYYDGQISDLYIVKAAKLKTELINFLMVSFTIDMWMSQANDAYLGTTLHYILSNCVLRSHLRRASCR